MKAPRIFVLAVLALPLAACGSSKPVLLNPSPEGVVVRYNQTNGSPDTAVAAANQFCAQYGRRAVQGTGNAMTGDTFVSFSCEK